MQARETVLQEDLTVPLERDSIRVLNIAGCIINASKDILHKNDVGAVLERRYPSREEGTYSIVFLRDKVLRSFESVLCFMVSATMWHSIIILLCSNSLGVSVNLHLFIDERNIINIKLL